MATYKDIASLAGVSQGTVSNVLNGRGNVSSQKIKLVEAAAAQLGYTINESAKTLRKGSSNVLALVLPNMRSRQYIDIYSRFKSYAEKTGYSVALSLTDDIPAREIALINKLRSDRVAAVVAVSCLSGAADPYMEAGFSPSELLYIERKPRSNCNYIGFDYYSAGKALGKIAASKKGDILLFTGAGSFSNNKALTDGFYSALSESDKVNLFEIDYQQRQKDIAQALSSCSHPSAVFALSYFLAQSLESVLKTFFPEMRDIPVHTVSPLYTLPESDFHKYELDYRLLGNQAAVQILSQISSPDQSCTETILANAGFRQWMPLPLPGPKPAELNLLMLKGPEATAVQDLSRIYTNKTGIRINVFMFSYDEIFETLETCGGQGYDILRIDITFMSWFAKKLLVPLQELDPSVADVLPSFLSGIARRYSTIDGIIYALPFSPSVQLLYYRRDLFESTVLKRLYRETYKKELAPPDTFADFNQIASFFTQSRNPNSPVKYGTSLTLGSIGVAASEFMARFLESHTNLYDDDGIVRLNSETGKRALHQLIDLKGCAPHLDNSWWTDTADLFASGELAMSILYSNYASGLKKAGSAFSEDIGCTLVPGRNPILGGASLGISQGCSNKETALNFIRWLCSETVSSASTLLGGVSPCKSAYMNYELIDTYPWLELAAKSFDIARGHRQPETNSTPFNERKFLCIIGMAVKNAYNGVQSPEAALDWAQAEFHKYFH